MRDNLKVGFIVLMACATTTTLGHYLPYDVWPVSYGLGALFAILTAAIYDPTT